MDTNTNTPKIEVKPKMRRDKVRPTKSFPVPTDGRGRSHRKYPFDTMEIGESFVMPASSRPGSVAHAKKTTGREFVVRKIDGNRYRVWRVK